MGTLHAHRKRYSRLRGGFFTAIVYLTHANDQTIIARTGRNKREPCYLRGFFAFFFGFGGA